MIVKLKQTATAENILELKKQVEKMGLTMTDLSGTYEKIFGLIGDTAAVDEKYIEQMEFVEKVTRIQQPYKKANIRFHPEPTVIDVNGVKIGGGNFTVFAGPCSVESEEQIMEVAKDVKASGATILRGGAFKPRTSPYAFQGMGGEGIQLLLRAKKETGLPICTEIMDISQLKFFDDVDILQVGARNMQNFTLLKELGKLDKPIFLKRGFSATYKEWLMSAEYIMAGGNEKVILCERGIRTFETQIRNTLDITAVPFLKTLTHLPIVIDPSHAAGMWEMVESLSLAATAAGTDGLMIEVHNDPEHALSDGPQCLKPERFDRLMKKVAKVREVLS